MALVRATMHLMADKGLEGLRPLLKMQGALLTQALLTGYHPTKVLGRPLRTDSPELADAAGRDESALQAAGGVWAQLSPPERKTLLQAVGKAAEKVNAEAEDNPNLAFEKETPEDLEETLEAAKPLPESP